MINTNVHSTWPPSFLEAPHLPPLIEEGDHFEEGQPLFVVEVMKMFNKVTASFSGTVDKVLLADDGVIISKGQSLFKVTPDDEIVIESSDILAERMRNGTHEFLDHVLI